MQSDSGVKLGGTPGFDGFGGRVGSLAVAISDYGFCLGHLIAFEPLGRSKHPRVATLTFSIKAESECLTAIGFWRPSTHLASRVSTFRARK